MERKPRKSSVRSAADLLAFFRRLYWRHAPIARLLSSPVSSLRPGAAVPIFDAHLHYSHDAWESVPPKDAIAILRKAGLQRALVSSSGDEGTQRLFADGARPRHARAAPLSHARRDRDLGARRDLRAYLEERLASYTATRRSANSISTAPTPTCRCRAAWSSSPSSTTSSCTRTPTSTRSSACSSSGPQARILWAHSGFDRPSACARCCASTRTCGATSRSAPITASGGKVGPGWRTTVPASFPTASWSAPTATSRALALHPGARRAGRARWLADLPRDVAERIAWKNGEAVFWFAFTSRSLICKRRVAACEPGIEGTRLESPRFVLAFRPEADLGCAAFRARHRRLREIRRQPEGVKVDAQMPEHRHGMNYRPR